MKNIDTFVRYEKDFQNIPIGLTVCDFIAMTPGPGFPRTRNTAVPVAGETFKRKPGEILRQGAAVGIDDAGLVRHIQLWHKMHGFLGFVERNLDGDKIHVTTQGCFNLAIPGLSPNDHGAKVYCTGPNDFSLKNDGLEIGRILYVDMAATNPRAMVAFQRFDATKRMVINLSRKTVNFL